jgi:RHS repeat-associated protein
MTAESHSVNRGSIPRGSNERDEIFVSQQIEGFSQGKLKVLGVQTHDGRETEVSTPDGHGGTIVDEAYTYDNAGNRTSATTGTTHVSSIGVAADNRITSDAKGGYLYDADGNRTQLNISGGAKVFYTYNAADQMTKVTQNGSGGTTTQTSVYTYDPVTGQRLTLADSGTVSQTELFVYDPTTGNALLVLNASGAVTERDLPGQQLNQVLAFETGMTGSGSGTVYWMVANNTGPVFNTETLTGGLQTQTVYSSFGVIESTYYAETPSRFGFAGMVYDAATGLNYDNARYYDPTQGAFVTQDPTGFGGGDYNLYRYARGNATTYTDRTGLAIYLDPNAGFSPSEIRFAKNLNYASLAYPQFAFTPGDPRLNESWYTVMVNGSELSDDPTQTYLHYNGGAPTDTSDWSDADRQKNQASLDDREAFDDGEGDRLAELEQEEKDAEAAADDLDRKHQICILTNELAHPNDDEKPNWNFPIPNDPGALNGLQLIDLYNEYLKRQNWAALQNELSQLQSGGSEDVGNFAGAMQNVTYISQLLEQLNQPSGQSDGVILALDMSASYSAISANSITINPLVIYLNLSTRTIAFGGQATVTQGIGGGVSAGASGGGTIYGNAGGLGDAGGQGSGLYANGTTFGGSAGECTGALGQTVPSVSAGMGLHANIAGGGKSAGAITNSYTYTQPYFTLHW